MLQWLRELWNKESDLTRNEAADLLERFVDGTCDPWEFDDFTSVRHKDPFVQWAAHTSARMDADYPPERNRRGAFCSEAGLARFREIIALLRDETVADPPNTIPPPRMAE